MMNEKAREINMKQADQFPSHLFNVSLDPVARWTIKVSYLNVGFAQDKCEGSSETEGYDRYSRQ